MSKGMSSEDMIMFAAVGIVGFLVYKMFQGQAPGPNVPPTGTVTMGPTTIVPQSQANIDFGITDSSNW